MDLYTLNAAGHPVRCADWLAWASTTEFRIARTPVGDGYVSTIFLGWRTPRDGQDPPLLFETMAVGIEGVDLEYRSATRAEALTAHTRAVAAARAVTEAARGEDASPPPAAA